MSEQPKRDYHQTDAEMLSLVLGHWIQSLLAGWAHKERLICSECWKLTSHLDWRATRDITYADLLNPDPKLLTCSFCYRNLSWLVPPAEPANKTTRNVDELISRVMAVFQDELHDRSPEEYRQMLRPILEPLWKRNL